MIRYSLVCNAGHEFEAWFGSSADYQMQQERGLLSCSHCGATEVTKAMMAPSVKSSRRGAAPDNDGAPVPATRLADTPAIPAEMVQQLRNLRKAVLANTEDVGNRFGEEARKIHYGEAELRGIRGQTNAREAAELIEEGIDILPVPQLPEEKN